MKITAEELINQINYYTDDISKLDIGKVSVKELINLLNKAKKNDESEKLSHEAEEATKQYKDLMTGDYDWTILDLYKILVKYPEITDYLTFEFIRPNEFTVNLTGALEGSWIYYFSNGKNYRLLFCQAVTNKQWFPLASTSDFTKLKKLLVEICNLTHAKFLPGKVEDYWYDFEKNTYYKKGHFEIVTEPVTVNTPWAH